MAYQENTRVVTFPAAADQTADQYKFGKIDANGRVALNTANGGYCEGVIYEGGGALGRATALAVDGIVKVRASAAITRGAAISATVAGLAQAATNGHIILGTALETGAANRIISVLLHPRGPA